MSNACNYKLTTLAPNGAKANLAILKYCIPNGIPMIVIHNMHPNTAFPNAIGIPKNMIHITFANTDGTPPPYSILFPNGANAIFANLKHCLPYGIPTILIHHNTPEKNHANPLVKPPQINHSMLPTRFMTSPPFLKT